MCVCVCVYGGVGVCIGGGLVCGWVVCVCVEVGGRVCMC